MLKPLTLPQITEIVGGQLVNAVDALAIERISKDTRTLQAGDLYIAIVGEAFDGHQFVAQAQSKGAAAAIVETLAADCALPQIQVANSIQALAKLAAFERQQFTGPIVAITGSAGKTTTKELTKAVVGQQFNSWMTQGNLNNHIGAPLTMLAVGTQHQAAVIELGASAVGEIAANAQWLLPNVAIITNAAGAHLEGFGSLQNVVATKGELLDFIQPNGVAIVNADDVHNATWVKRALTHGVNNLLLFGFSEHADVRADNIEAGLAGCQFDLLYRAQKHSVRLPLLGEHNVANALAAAAAGFALGLTMAQVVAGLESVAVVAGRLQSLVGAQGQTVLNDSYNANPASVRAAIEVLKKAKHGWLVLGDMAELGADEVQQHEQIGQFAKQQGIQHLLATGQLAKHAVSGFGEGAQWFADKQQLAEFLQENTQENDVILVKGSRSAAMESIVEQLQQNIKVG